TFVSGFLELVLGFFRGLFLLGIMEEDNRAVLGPDIRPLAVELGGIVVVPENVQQLFIGNLLGVVFHFHHFGVARSVRANILVGGIVHQSPLISHSGGSHSL